MLKIYTFFLLFTACTLNVQAQCGVYAYITNSADNTVNIINVNTSVITATIPVGAFPFGVSTSPDGSKAYIVNGSAGSITVINTADNTVTTINGVGTSLFGITNSPDGSRVYTTDQSNDVVIAINAINNSIVATIPVGSHPGGVVISPDGSTLYVANEYSGTVSVINTADNTVTNNITVNNGPVGMVITPDGGSVYVACNTDNTVNVINTTTNVVTTTISVGLFPLAMTITPNGSSIYVTNANDNTVSAINTTTNTVTVTIAVGLLPLGISSTPDGSKIYVANNTDNTISVINASDNTVVETITVGSGPFPFGNFITNTCGTALPLSFILFEAQYKNNNEVLLDWKTADEINTSHFIIQRSINGATFKVVGSIPANNLSGNYQYTDQLLPQDLSTHPTLYYRIKEIDQDGKAVYSRTTSITLSDIQEASFNLSPNPAINNTIHIKGNKLKRIEIIDNSGRICLAQDVINSSLADIDIHSLKQAIYFVRIINKSGKKFLKKLVVIK
jgi:YVTN family beta-propeller protein